jgi:hypothetical protein
VNQDLNAHTKKIVIRRRDGDLVIELLGFGANNKKKIPTEPRIAQIYLSSNVVTTCTLVDRSQGSCPRTGVDDEADVADLKVVKNSTYQRHDASAPWRLDASAMAPAQQHSAARGVHRITPTRTAHHDSF